ncbi:MAG TPA: peptidoglycan-binding protein, partial [Lapillicoccus sp.]|nr:peptidoglycan-binding protein [Lapillicoccus sp.]
MTEPRTGILARLGYRGPAVRDLRESLTAAGALPTGDGFGSKGDDVFDEVFDEELDAAVRSFQQDRGLLVDGIVGPWTFAALDAARWRLGDRLLRHSPGHLVRGDDVMELQERLLGFGF